MGIEEFNDLMLRRAIDAIRRKVEGFELGKRLDGAQQLDQTALA